MVVLVDVLTMPHDGWQNEDEVWGQTGSIFDGGGSFRGSSGSDCNASVLPATECNGSFKSPFTPWPRENRMLPNQRQLGPQRLRAPRGVVVARADGVSRVLPRRRIGVDP